MLLIKFWRRLFWFANGLDRLSNCASISRKNIPQVCLRLGQELTIPCPPTTHTHLNSPCLYSNPAALSPNETLGKECDQGTGEQNLTAEKVPTPSTSTQNVDISDMNPESLAEWLVKEIGELYLADINKLKGIQLRVNKTG